MKKNTLAHHIFRERLGVTSLSYANRAILLIILVSVTGINNAVHRKAIKIFPDISIATLDLLLVVVFLVAIFRASHNSLEIYQIRHNELSIIKRMIRLGTTYYDPIAKANKKLNLRKALLYISLLVLLSGMSVIGRILDSYHSNTSIFSIGTVSFIYSLCVLVGPLSIFYKLLNINMEINYG